MKSGIIEIILSIILLVEEGPVMTNRYFDGMRSCFLVRCGVHLPFLTISTYSSSMHQNVLF